MIKNRKLTKYILAIMIPMIALLTLVSGNARRSEGPGRADRAKARHYYLSAVKQEVAGNNAESAELYRKAYEADSTYAEAALQYGLRRLGMPQEAFLSDAEKAKSRRITQKFLDLYPGDFFPNILYANVMETSMEMDEAINVIERLHKADPGNTDILQMLSNLYLDNGESEKAIETLDAYARIEGEDPEYFIRKTGIRAAMGDTIGSINEAKKWIEKTPADPSSVAFLAQVQNIFGMKEEALESFRKAESMMEPNTGGNIKLQMANYYNSLGDSVNFDNKTYEALLCEDLDFDTKKDVLAYYLQGIIDENGDRARGDKLFGVLLNQYPHEPELLSLASRYSASKKDYQKALEEIDYALDLDHTNNDYWDTALYLCMMADDYDRGDEYFEKVKKYIDQPAVSTYSLAGGMALMKDKPERALEIYKEEMEQYFPGQNIDGEMNMEALRSNLKADDVNTLAILYQEIGDAWYKLDDKEKAFKNYENSLKLNPNSALTLNNYAYYLTKAGKGFSEEELEKADEMSKRVMTLSPDQPTYIDTRAWVLFCKGEYKEAKEMQLKALELLGEDADVKDNSEFFEHLGDILFMNKEPEEAVENWKKALEGEPDKDVLRRKVQQKTFFYE